MRANSLDDAEIVRTALLRVGVKVGSVWDLVNRPTPKIAVPVLVHLLPELEDAKTREAVARALTIRKAGRPVLQALIDELRRIAATAPPNELLGWAVSNGVSVVVERDDEAFEDLQELLKDSRLGRGRQMLAEAVAKTQHPKAATVLLELLEDEALTGHVIHALGRIPARSARSRIEPFLNHRNAWIRKEARNALRRIDAADLKRKHVN